MGPIYDPNNLIGNVYPSDISSSSYYVFFNSLFYKNPPGREIAEFAADYFDSTMLLSNTSHTSSITNSVTIENVLSFLDTIIQNEFSKETAFLNYLGKIKNIKITIPSLNEDWSSFIQQVQEITQIGQAGLTNLQLEYERLLSNSTRITHYYDSYKSGNMSLEQLANAQSGYQRSGNVETTQQLRKVIDFLSGAKNNTTGKTIINYIIKKYGARLLNFENNKLVLNQSELANAILGISHILLDRYNAIKKEIQLLEKQQNIEKSKRKYFNIANDFEDILQQDEKLEEDINRMLQLDNLPFVTKSMKNTYKIQTSNRTNKDFSNLTSQIQKRSENQEELLLTADELQQYYSEHNLQQEITVKLISNKNAVSEIQRVVYGLVSSAFHGSQVGGVNAKTDELLGYLEIIAPDGKTPQISKIRSTMEKISNKLDKLEQGFSSTNNFDYYKKRKKDWDKAIKEIKQLIDTLAKELDIIINCYVVEDSTKSYESLLVRKFDKDKKDHFKFSGGKQGNIADAMRKIDALSRTGGITFNDTNWLLNACINAGPGMIGAENRSNLESYFSAIAAILLFDNQIGIVTEAFTNSIPSSGTSVKQIHLFSLNNGTYPLSYVLKLTRNHLYKVYVESLNMVNNGAQATITGFVSQPAEFDPASNPMTPSHWSALSKTAINSVKIEVTFLAGFLGILNSFMKINE